MEKSSTFCGMVMELVIKTSATSAILVSWKCHGPLGVFQGLVWVCIYLSSDPELTGALDSD